MNKVILFGNLTRDVELRHTANSSVAGFGVAVNRKWKNAAGESQEETTFVDCEAWGKTGEIIAQYFAKGAKILVEGRLKLDQWEDKDGGAKRSKIKVVVESFHFTGNKAEANAAKPAQAKRPTSNATVTDDDIPW